MSTQEAKLRAIADAIREKEGSAAPIPANDFPARIRAISTAPEGLYTITVEPDNEASGNVLGGGAASEGMVVTVWADAAEDYTFTGWQENGQTVSTDAEYTFPVEGNRALTAAFAKQSRLPTGYTELEYIQSDLGSYIQTDITSNFKNLRIVMDVEYLGSALSGSRYTLSTNNATSNVYLIFMRYTGGKIMYRFSNNTGVYQSVSLDDERVTVDLNFQTQKLSVGNSVFDLYAADIANNNTIRLFGANSDKGKLYSTKIYMGGTLTADYVPCTNPSGEIGVYDLVGRKFYSNFGTKAFTAGPAV